jgi:hypothetical protein
MIRGIKTMTDYEEGFLMGVLVGEGHFGGDMVQAQVNVRMHIRQQKLLARLLRMFPGSKLYGPYHHNNRHYMQWMARGKTLRQDLLPILLRNLEFVDDHIRQRIEMMIERYKLCDTELLYFSYPDTVPRY